MNNMTTFFYYQKCSSIDETPTNIFVPIPTSFNMNRIDSKYISKFSNLIPTLWCLWFVCQRSAVGHCLVRWSR